MRKCWKLCETDDIDKTLGEGRIRHYASLIAAANSMAKSKYPYAQIIFDNGHVARELTDREQEFVEHVVGMLGIDLEETGT
jgi:hypothetical protein